MDKVELIPWDHTSEAHYERMYDQRIACGWRANEVPDWKDSQLKGNKAMYWVVRLPPPQSSDHSTLRLAENSVGACR